MMKIGHSHEVTTEILRAFSYSIVQVESPHGPYIPVQNGNTYLQKYVYHITLREVLNFPGNLGVSFLWGAFL